MFLEMSLAFLLARIDVDCFPRYRLNPDKRLTLHVKRGFFAPYAVILTTVERSKYLWLFPSSNIFEYATNTKASKKKKMHTKLLLYHCSLKFSSFYTRHDFSLYEVW